MGIPMSMVVSDSFVTKAMYDAARAGLAGCMSCVEKIAMAQQLGFEAPDAQAVINEWQPRLEAVIQQYNEQQSRRV